MHRHVSILLRVYLDLELPSDSSPVSDFPRNRHTALRGACITLHSGQNVGEASGSSPSPFVAVFAITATLGERETMPHGSDSDLSDDRSR